MNKLYKKNELSFSIVLIVFYVVLFSVGDNLSSAVGIEKSITLPICILFTAVILIWLKKNNLFEYYGLCGLKGEYKHFLYFLPLVIISTRNFWAGISFNKSVLETLLYICSMIFVGFLEEIIFRGFLFKAMCKDNVKTAIAVSSITFGVGHIVNLLNGADLFSTLMQIVYATIVGFLFTIIFCYGKSILPCIIAHSVINATSVFGVELEDKFRIIFNLILIIISLAYTMYLIRKHKALKTEIKN